MLSVSECDTITTNPHPDWKISRVRCRCSDT